MSKFPSPPSLSEAKKAISPSGPTNNEFSLFSVLIGYPKLIGSPQFPSGSFLDINRSVPPSPGWPSEAKYNVCPSGCIVTEVSLPSVLRLSGKGSATPHVPSSCLWLTKISLRCSPLGPTLRIKYNVLPSADNEG